MTDDLNALRHIEGFPIGEDEDIHALSDPPFYTAYPNPHIAEFVAKSGKPYDEATDNYQREPYVADVSEGKNDPIYNAHGYHTKVPYKAIVPFIEHYTNPGDIVFDGFCGTGMTGIAAQTAGRRAILCDLSPAASFIAYNYNVPVEAAAFERAASHALDEVQRECKWMYETQHSDGRLGQIEFVVWSDVFICPYCGNEIVFWDAAVNQSAGEVRDSFLCPGCLANVTKRELDHAFVHLSDPALGHQIRRAKRVPVLINYSLGTRRYEKGPNAMDLALVLRIEEQEIPYWYPCNRMPEGDEARRNDPIGVTHVHHFYTNRNLWVLATFWHKAIGADRQMRHALQWVETGAIQRATLMHQLAITRIATDKPVDGGKTAGHRRGTLYIPSLQVEFSPLALLKTRIREASKTFAQMNKRTSGRVIIACESASTLSNLQPNSVDYIFTDPPFGENIMYSELNFMWEAWLRALTNNRKEAIINKTQTKSLAEYRNLMTECFETMFRVLKPGRWITVVFHNSKASVWNAIQESLVRAGFLVAQVTVLDKVKKTHTQVTAAGAVKNDLVINAYKPRAGFTQRFISSAGQGLEADFVRQHLAQLPLAANIERSKEMLYSKYLAYYVQHGYQVAYNAEQFYRALGQWGFVERDGYWFADEKQANEYEKRKAGTLGKTPAGQAVLFVSDERSARQWLWHFLDRPKPYGDIYTAYVKALQTSEDQLPELRAMLEEGFMPSNGDWRRPDAVSQAELERRRQARLLAQFAEYLATARGSQRLSEVRREAVVAGFAEAYRAARYQDILTVGRKLPKRLIEDDPDIFDFIDITESKMEG